jgi:hypothetical protein
LGQRQTGGAKTFQVEPWEKAADCARAIAATKEPTKREILTNVRNLWMALAEQRSFLSDAELAEQIEVIGRIHSDLAEPGRSMVH